MHKPICLTPGEPAGIGPDITLMLAARYPNNNWVAIADKTLLHSRANDLGLDVSIHNYQPNDRLKSGLNVWHVPLNTPCEAGLLNPANVPYVLQTLEVAASSCLSGHFGGLVTGPVHKANINAAGVRFDGHTGWLAHRARVPKTVMCFVAESLKVALLSTHIPLAEVPNAVTTNNLIETLTLLATSLHQLFQINNPHILVLGLNPHAGEQGHIGHEEQTIIIPTLNQLRTQGFKLSGPVPADTAFNPEQLKQYDAVLAMYHDQGLIPIKQIAFGTAINLTLGLPFIRTSVDHGTALEIAATGRANPSSFIQAIQLAQSLQEPQHDLSLPTA